VELVVPEGLLGRVDAARGDVSRSQWIRRALESALEPSLDVQVAEARRRVSASRGAVEDDVPSPSRSSVAEQAAAPVLPRAPVVIPGVVRGSSLAKSGVRPIPKGKGK
jgi:hypothetical protein